MPRRQMVRIDTNSNGTHTQHNSRGVPLVRRTCRFAQRRTRRPTDVAVRYVCAKPTHITRCGFATVRAARVATRHTRGHGASHIVGRYRATRCVATWGQQLGSMIGPRAIIDNSVLFCTRAPLILVSRAASIPRHHLECK